MSCYIILQDGGQIILESGTGFLVLNDCEESNNGWLGGTFNDPYANAERLRKAHQLRDTQEEIIRLRKEAQELRLQELETERAQDKQTKRQLAALAHTQAKLLAQLQEKLQMLALLQQDVELRNQQALLVLSMACPFLTLNLGGETMH